MITIKEEKWKSRDHTQEVNLNQNVPSFDNNGKINISLLNTKCVFVCKEIS